MVDWNKSVDLLSSQAAEVFVRLKSDVRAHPSRDDQAYWWGRSVHQVATVDAEGVVRCNNRPVDLSAIDGWLEIPK